MVDGACSATGHQTAWHGPASAGPAGFKLERRSLRHWTASHACCCPSLPPMLQSPGAWGAGSGMQLVCRVVGIRLPCSDAPALACLPPLGNNRRAYQAYRCTCHCCRAAPELLLGSERPTAAIVRVAAAQKADGWPVAGSNAVRHAPCMGDCRLLALLYQSPFEPALFGFFRAFSTGFIQLRRCLARNHHGGAAAGEAAVARQRQLPAGAPGVAAPRSLARTHWHQTLVVTGPSCLPLLPYSAASCACRETMSAQRWGALQPLALAQPALAASTAD